MSHKIDYEVEKYNKNTNRKTRGKMKNETMIVDTQNGETVWGYVADLYTSARCRGYNLRFGDNVTLVNRGYGDRVVLGFTTDYGISSERA